MISLIRSQLRDRWLRSSGRRPVGLSLVTRGQDNQPDGAVLKEREGDAPVDTTGNAGGKGAANARDAAGAGGAAAEGQTPGAATPRAGTWQPGLSAKLVGFVLLFVMLAEILIFVPSIATFRQNWLSNRLAAAQLVSLAADVTPDSRVPEALKAELLRTAQIRMVALKRNDQRRLILQVDMDTAVSETYDLRPAQRGEIWRRPMTGVTLIGDALAVFFTSDDTFIRVIGEPGENAGEVIEVVMPVGPLKAAMIQHGINVFALSVLISMLTAVPLYLLLNAMFIRPITGLTQAMERFSRKPEDASRIIVPSDRRDEIGVAERELQHMQVELAQTLSHKSRLAALGLAVSKINHDLRNLLANAQLMSDRLASVPEPTVQRLAPKLVASIDRAIRFCNDTLQYGRAAEPQPRREPFDLRSLVVDVGEGLDLASRDGLQFEIDVADGISVNADRDQMYRVLTNLVRNALQAIEANATPSTGRPGSVQATTGGAVKSPVDGETTMAETIAISGHQTVDAIVIDVSDSGPGVPERVRSKLFRPFEGSTRRDGTGLGLSIVQEILAAHGGRIAYLSDATDADGGLHGRSRFRIELPNWSVNSNA